LEAVLWFVLLVHDERGRVAAHALPADYMRPLEIVGHGTLSRRFADCPLNHGREDCAVDWNNRRARTLNLLRRGLALGDEFSRTP